MATSKELSLAKEGEGSPLYPSCGGSLAPVCHNLRLQILQQQQIDGSFLSISMSLVCDYVQGFLPFQTARSAKLNRSIGSRLVETSEQEARYKEFVCGA